MILGSGMSSRLFQEVREKRGLVYYINSYTETTPDVSLFCINAGFSPDKINEFVPALQDEVMTITKYINDDEIDRAINQYEAGIKMSNERSSSRVSKMISDLMIYGSIIETSYIMEIVKNLSKKDIMNTMESVLSRTPTLAVYGNIDDNGKNVLLKGY